MIPNIKPEGLYEKFILKIKGEPGLKKKREKELQLNLNALKSVVDKINEKKILWDDLVKDLEIISNHKMEKTEREGTLINKTGYALSVPEGLCLEMNMKYLKETLGFEKPPTKNAIIFEINGEAYLDISRKMTESHIIPEGANKLTPLGSGTERDPYQIWYLDQLLYIDKDATNGKETTRAASYKLMRSLDFKCDHHYLILDNKKDWTEGKGWYPLGNPPVKSTYLATHESAKVSFAGYFDGNHKEIRNLYINRPDYAYQALFGQSNGARIKSLTLKDVSVVGKGYVGSLVGQAGYTKIKRCYMYGKTAGAYATGGMVGYLQNKSIVDKTFFKGEVNGEFYTGGALGIAHSSEVKRSYSEGTVNGIQITGGFVGQTYASKVDNCYTESIVKGKEKESGGFLGEATEKSEIRNCYSSGNITGETRVGEFGGDVTDGTKIIKCVSTSNILEGDIGITDNFIGHDVQSEIIDSGKILDMKDIEKYFKWENLTWEKRTDKLPTLDWTQKLF